jgi:hypothetical protein
VSILIPGQTPPSNKKPIYARSGWEIPLANVEDQPVIDLIRIRSRELAEWRPNVKIRSVSDYPYNCVGMIFASRRAWIEIDHIYDLIREDSYRRVHLDQLMEGDIVLYKDHKNEPSHVALVIQIERTLSLNIRVISKWGKDGEFVHLINDVPALLGKPVEYYTDRER